MPSQYARNKKDTLMSRHTYTLLLLLTLFTSHSYSSDTEDSDTASTITASSGSSEDYAIFCGEIKRFNSALSRKPETLKRAFEARVPCRCIGIVVGEVLLDLAERGAVLNDWDEYYALLKLLYIIPREIHDKTGTTSPITFSVGQEKAKEFVVMIYNLYKGLTLMIENIFHKKIFEGELTSLSEEKLRSVEAQLSYAIREIEEEFNETFHESPDQLRSGEEIVELLGRVRLKGETKRVSFAWKPSAAVFFEPTTPPTELTEEDSPSATEVTMLVREELTDLLRQSFTKVNLNLKKILDFFDEKGFTQEPFVKETARRFLLESYAFLSLLLSNGKLSRRKLLAVQKELLLKLLLAARTVSHHYPEIITEIRKVEAYRLRTFRETGEDPALSDSHVRYISRAGEGVRHKDEAIAYLEFEIERFFGVGETSSATESREELCCAFGRENITPRGGLVTEDKWNHAAEASATSRAT